MYVCIYIYLLSFKYSLNSPQLFIIININIKLKEALEMLKSCIYVTSAVLVFLDISKYTLAWKKLPVLYARLCQTADAKNFV